MICRSDMHIRYLCIFVIKKDGIFSSVQISWKSSLNIDNSNTFKIKVNDKEIKTRHW